MRKKDLELFRSVFEEHMQINRFYWFKNAYYKIDTEHFWVMMVYPYCKNSQIPSFELCFNCLPFSFAIDALDLLGTERTNLSVQFLRNEISANKTGIESWIGDPVTLDSFQRAFNDYLSLVAPILYRVHTMNDAFQTALYFYKKTGCRPYEWDYVNTTAYLQEQSLTLNYLNELLSFKESLRDTYRQMDRNEYVEKLLEKRTPIQKLSARLNKKETLFDIERIKWMINKVQEGDMEFVTMQAERRILDSYNYLFYYIPYKEHSKVDIALCSS